MPVLDQLASLNAPIAAVQEAVQRVVVAQHQGSDALTKAAALASLQATADSWLTASAAVESVLTAYLPNEPDDSANEADNRSDDEAEAAQRIGGLSLIHLAAACDIAKLAPLDALSDGEPVSAADHASTTSAIQAVVGDGPDEGGVGRAIAAPTQQTNAADDNQQATGTSGRRARCRIFGRRRRSARAPEPVAASDVLAILVDRATIGVRSVLVGAAPSPQAVFNAVTPYLNAAIDLAPADVARAAEQVAASIIGLAKRIFRRVYDLIDLVTQGRLNALVGGIIDVVQPQELIVDRAVRAVVEHVVHRSEIDAHIVARERQHSLNAQARVEKGQPPDSAPDITPALGKILKHNNRWVRWPVPIAARFLHSLWSVPIGPVPAAPIAACLLIAWTIAFTGDQLDARGPFPNFWRPGLYNLV